MMTTTLKEWNHFKPPISIRTDNGTSDSNMNKILSKQIDGPKILLTTTDSRKSEFRVSWDPGNVNLALKICKKSKCK